MENEQYYEKMLNIDTTDKQVKLAYSNHYYAYEPTPYHALVELFNKYELRGDDRVVDFGCGKGRIPFFIHYFLKVPVVGVEMDTALYQTATVNYDHYAEKHRLKKEGIQFYNGLAEDYPIHPNDSHFYFFNPFSSQIFKRITSHILLSFEQHPRELDILLYYPSEDYIDFLESQTPFQLKQEVVIDPLYSKNPYEHFLIYSMNA